MKPKLKLLDPDSSRKDDSQPEGTRIATLQAWSSEGPWIGAVRREDAPKFARWSTAINEADLVKACNDKADALVVYTDDGVPVITALLANPTATEPCIDVHVDGQRVELVAHEELTLRCGDACISLTKDGRVIVRGVQVETRAKGANRIRGGTVEIN